MRDTSKTELKEGLGERQAEILGRLLDLYTSSGEPVGSKALAEQRPGGVCSATIRHVLAELEEAGYLVQPHTSAGRVPTAKAIQWWLRHLAQTVLAAPVASADARKLEAALQHAGDEATLWLHATQFLSDVSHQVGLVALQPWQDAGLKHLRFIRLTGQRVLAVLVATDGQIRERVGRVPEPYTQIELDAAARYFVLNFSGMTLTQIRRELLRRVEEERAAYDEMLKRVLVLSHCGVMEMQNTGEVYFQGARNLAEALDSPQLSHVLDSLQQKERWLRLLNEVSAEAERVGWGGEDDTLGQADGVRVQIGLEREALPQIALITARCRAADAAIGILGSTRMEYARALGAVALVRDLCNRVFESHSS